MERNYTEAIRDGYFDLIENDITEIWQGLELSAERVKSDQWREHYEKIVSRYRFSGRFAIMRVLFEEETKIRLTKIDADALKNGFSVQGIGVFPDISIEHAEKMTEDEVNCYERLLLRRVEENDPDWFNQAENLIKRMLALPTTGVKSALSRDEIIRLGHMLNFSMEHMQFILLRVLGDNEAGFSYSKSMDLIDVFGFVHHFKLSEVDALKDWYNENLSQKHKARVAEKPIQFTQNIASSLEQTFMQWSPEECIEQFRVWLCQQAPYLDVKSKSARKVYINLAANAYYRIKPVSKISEDAVRMKDLISNDLYRDMHKLSRLEDYHEDAKRLLFAEAKTKPDEKKCKEVADELIYENAEYAGVFHTHTENSESFFHVLHVQKGKISARGSLNRKSKKRIVDILMGETSPTKSDLLYLLWFVVNSHWLDMEGRAEAKAEILNDFLNSAACLLEAALLPEFYPPNVLEETMIMSIVLASEKCMPAVVYESICRSFTDEGVVRRQAGTTNKTPAEKRKIAEYYYSHLVEHETKGACKEACAALFGVGKASIDNYVDQYIAQYYLDHMTEYASPEDCRDACAKIFGVESNQVENKCKKYPKGFEKKQTNPKKKQDERSGTRWT